MPTPLSESHVERLAKLLLNDQLVLFVGAGISHQAKARDASGRRLPLWRELAEHVAAQCGEKTGNYSQSILDLFDAIANEPGMALSFQMEPGDFQLVNNYCVLHARTNFEDYAEPDRRRHLLRLWLATPNSRELPPVFEKRFGSCKGGAVRGGIPPAKKPAGGDRVEKFDLHRA